MKACITHVCAIYYEENVVRWVHQSTYVLKGFVRNFPSWYVVDIPHEQAWSCMWKISSYSTTCSRHLLRVKKQNTILSSRRMNIHKVCAQDVMVLAREEQGSPFVRQREDEATSSVVATFPIQPRKHALSIRYNCLSGTWMIDLHVVVQMMRATFVRLVSVCLQGLVSSSCYDSSFVEHRLMWTELLDSFLGGICIELSSSGSPQCSTLCLGWWNPSSMANRFASSPLTPTLYSFLAILAQEPHISTIFWHVIQDLVLWIHCRPSTPTAVLWWGAGSAFFFNSSWKTPGLWTKCPWISTLLRRMKVP